mgnify:CR=1 FL=1
MKLPRWGLQVSEHLRRHDLQLDLDKEVYQEKLAEIYAQQDLCDLTVGTVDSNPAPVAVVDTADGVHRPSSSHISPQAIRRN